MRILILDDYQQVARSSAAWERLEPEHELTFLHQHVADPSALVSQLRDFAIVVAMRERTPFPAAVLDQLPNLRLLVTTGMRNASIDMEAAARAGIAVCGTRGLTYPTAELAFGHILSLARRIPMEDRALRAGQWQTSLGIGLRAKTLGILGLGTLGSQLAGYGSAFGMDVLAWSQNLTDERASDAGATRVPFKDLLQRADFISIHLVLSDRTRGLIGAEQLAQMKSTAFLVNTSRGPIIDYDALVDALEKQRIAGAGLDVYGDEPLAQDAPIRRAPNTVLTPHLGYVTAETYQVFYGEALEDVEAFLRNAPVRLLNQPATRR